MTDLERRRSFPFDELRVRMTNLDWEGKALGNGICGSHSCAQNAREWGSLCGMSCRRKPSSSGEYLAAALHGEGNAGSFDCAPLRFAQDDRVGERSG